MSQLKKENRGGARKGSGRPKADKPTKVISIRVPADRYDQLKIAIDKLVNEALEKK